MLHGRAATVPGRQCTAKDRRLPMRGVVSLALLLSMVAGILGGEGSNLAMIGLPKDLVAPDTVAVAGATVAFLEGPAVDAAGNVFFSDIAGNRILKLDAKGKVSVFRADSGQTNGNAFDAAGRLISCEGGEQMPGR